MVMGGEKPVTGAAQPCSASLKAEQQGRLGVRVRGSLFESDLAGTCGDLLQSLRINPWVCDGVLH